MKNIFNFILPLVFIVSCSMEDSNEVSTESVDDRLSKVYYTEFMPCTAGPDYTSENMTKMISEWQKLLTNENLQGVWGYAPAVATNSFPDNGWWEIQWGSKEEAQEAWSEWSQNEEAAAWNDKYASVLQCDESMINGFESVFPIASAQYSELPDSGYFYSEVHICELNDGSTQEEAISFLSGFTEAVSNADYSDTSYHLGNYFNTDGSGGFLWANFTNSEESMDKANASFEASVRESMFPIFTTFASCGEVPDLYHGFTLYNAENKDFMPTFPSN
jgi:hypothetical protein